MMEVDIRKYEVKAADFPITVLVAAKNLPVCQAVASRVQVKQGGQVTGSIPVGQEQDPVHGTMGYQIPDPGTGPGADLIQNLDCWFPDDAPEGSRYEVTITSAQADHASSTKGSRPTINPRTITLTFLYR